MIEYQLPLPSIAWFVAYLNDGYEIELEQCESFLKQTYRNRTTIFGANGKLSLIIPIQHDGRKLMGDIQVSDAENWRQQHWKSIKNAYQSSPYFEHYEFYLKNIYTSDVTSLSEFNLNAIQIILKILKIEKAYILNTEYSEIPNAKDFRNEFSAKSKQEYRFSEYYQTFSDKLGFVENLSILDLICNLGPESYSYLKNNHLTI